MNHAGFICDLLRRGTTNCGCGDGRSRGPVIVYRLLFLSGERGRDGISGLLRRHIQETHPTLKLAENAETVCEDWVTFRKSRVHLLNFLCTSFAQCVFQVVQVFICRFFPQGVVQVVIPRNLLRLHEVVHPVWVYVIFLTAGLGGKFLGAPQVVDVVVFRISLSEPVFSKLDSESSSRRF